MVSFDLASAVGEGYLCHDSFRAAKEKRRRLQQASAAAGVGNAARAPADRANVEWDLWLLNVITFDPPTTTTATADKLTTVRLRGGIITDVLDSADVPQQAGDRLDQPAVVLDCGGRLFLLPGLMDAHVHCTAVIANLTELRTLPPSLIAARAAPILSGMLARGFTTVRDAGGCDWGLAAATDEGTVLGPTILFSGRALSQTGGHGDMRAKGAEALECGGGNSGCPCACAAAAGIGRVCDGADAVRKACREELRLGCHWIKLMASGGVSSPTDSLEQPQFSREELRAACEEASARGSYAGAHAYTPISIRRAVAAGVRSIEHGNFLDEECAKEMAQAGAFLVPTLITYDALVSEGLRSGFPAPLVEKARGVAEAGARSLALARQAGVRICYGSDLLGQMHSHQSREFELRLKAGCSAEELLQQATANCAALFQRENDLGKIAVGYKADLILTTVDPRRDLMKALVEGGGSNVVAVLKDGILAKAPSAAVGDGVNRALFGGG
jgi:imidazolonepropionase-like amidohydrolase